MTYNYINVSDNECNSFAVIRATELEPILAALNRAVCDQYGYDIGTSVKFEALYGYHLDNILTQLRQGTFTGSPSIRVTVGEDKYYITLEQTWLYTS